MDSEDLRADIPVTSECAFFNTGASGPSPHGVLDAIDEFHHHHKVTAPCEDGMYPFGRQTRDAARETIAEFLSATPGEIALTRNTVEGINHVAGAIDWQPGDVVVRPDFEHPAGVLPWDRLAGEGDIEVRVLESDDGRLDLDALARAVEDARLLCLSSLTWNYGTQIPLPEVVDIAHEADTLVLVDAVQSVGQMPVNVTAWGADFVAASGHKWLLGPWGAGFLYVDESTLSDLSPGRVGYFSVAESTEPSIGTVGFHPDARRFELGTTALGPYAGLVEAIDIVTEIGIRTIQTEIERLTDRLKDGLGEELLSPREYEGGLVTFGADDPEATVARLENAGVHIRSLPEPSACRASVHAFNTEEEIDRLLDAV